MVDPFLVDAKSNDASIVKNLLYENKQCLLEWLHGDVILIDTGFRNAARVIKILDFHLAIPRFLSLKKQLLATYVSYTRCVTKARWVIESSRLTSTFILLCKD